MTHETRTHTIGNFLLPVSNFRNHKFKVCLVGNSWLKSFLGSVGSQKVFLQSTVYPQITTVPTQLRICLFCFQKPSQSGFHNFVIINPHNWAERKKWALSPLIGWRKKLVHSNNWATKIWVSQDYKVTTVGRGFCRLIESHNKWFRRAALWLNLSSNSEELLEITDCTQLINQSR